MILDYLKAYGGISFDEVPINYLDVMAFSQLSYFDYPSECWGMTITEAMAKGIVQRPTPNEGPKLGAESNAEKDANDEELLKLVCEASRYAALRVIAFAEDFKEGAQQFGALALELDDLLVVAFRGTDETVSGWSEALRLSLDEPVASQLLAADFLQQVAAETEGPIIVCGHSKGGNLAEYSAVVCAGKDERLSERIAAVVSFDGPGLPPVLRDTDTYADLAPRMITYIPKSSVVGNIHEHPEDAVVFVDSNSVFMAQHVVYSWLTAGTRFVRASQSLIGRMASGFLGFLVNVMDDTGKGRLFDMLLFLPKVLGRK